MRSFDSEEHGAHTTLALYASTRKQTIKIYQFLASIVSLAARRGFLESAMWMNCMKAGSLVLDSTGRVKGERFPSPRRVTGSIGRLIGEEVSMTQWLELDRPQVAQRALLETSFSSTKIASLCVTCYELHSSRKHQPGSSEVSKVRCIRGAYPRQV
jgi:hypothetical protein